MTDAIVDRCPECGAQSLFIGSGGFLTCSVIGCKNPAVGEVIREQKSSLESLRSRVTGMLEDSRRFYNADGSFILLESAEAAVAARKASALQLLVVSSHAAKLADALGPLVSDDARFLGASGPEVDKGRRALLAYRASLEIPS